MAQDRLTMTFLFCRPYDIIIWAGQGLGYNVFIKIILAKYLCVNYFI